ncbi:hypothetical protein CPB84DRAFT_1818630 [Gymnopilus junonius]|uniref:CxC6 like cysteine cluster associated with KDZ domain-containing protein n=1 Tax=Gymnopilus junonius TaxID=109634 RepID=A0A9P5TEJ1_GYMJU|nr:hypothetical protein CPB84DRAFT_1818630 [Gymnopilus junonius]
MWTIRKCQNTNHCAYDNCTEELQNACGGAFCTEHEIAYGTKCCIRTCHNERVARTLACAGHQGAWKKYKQDHSHAAYSGVRRLLQRIEENLPWQQRTTQPAARAHDNHEDDDDPPPRAHFFGSSKFYCVETVCAPCGVVIAWTKFNKSESPTHILNFLQSIFPTRESRLSYVCIDKACRVLRTAIANGTWRTVWRDTTRFIVDAYHYRNHRLTDFLCRKWCNPAPLNGSAPNLVRIAYDKNGRPYLQRAYNTQACEQLNAWLGGFESILKQMKIGNFDWFLHAMLFYHTQQVIAKQRNQEKVEQIQQDEEEEDEEEEKGPVRHWHTVDENDEDDD